MYKSINLKNQKIDYQIKTSNRIKYMRLSIYQDGSFIITRPRGVSENIIEKFIIQKSNWIIDKIKNFSQNKPKISKIESRKIYLQYKEPARRMIENKITKLNKFYNFKYNRISIRNQKTRWGSCSRRGNLSFSYKILFLSEYLAEYIIVHELCHLKEFNHSYKFWNLISKIIPNYLEIRKELKKIKLF